MKGYSLFSYQYLFSDHMAKASLEARLLYIKMNFYALNGFVPNVLQIVDSMGLTRSHLQELINLDEVLTIADRDEVFITSFFLHNKGADTRSWWNSPYAIYWRDKLWIKKNRIATLKPIVKDETESLSANVKAPDGDDPSWDAMLDEIK